MGVLKLSTSIDRNRDTELSYVGSSHLGGHQDIEFKSVVLAGRFLGTFF